MSRGNTELFVVILVFQWYWWSMWNRCRKSKYLRGCPQKFIEELEYHIETLHKNITLTVTFTDLETLKIDVSCCFINRTGSSKFLIWSLFSKFINNINDYFLSVCLIILFWLYFQWTPSQIFLSFIYLKIAHCSYFYLFSKTLQQ